MLENLSNEDRQMLSSAKLAENNLALLEKMSSMSKYILKLEKESNTNADIYSHEDLNDYLEEYTVAPLAEPEIFTEECG